MTAASVASSRPQTAADRGRRVGRRHWLRARRLVPLLSATVSAGYVAVTYPGYRSAMSKACAELAAGSQVVSTRVGPIEYAEEGDGPAVLVVHGAGGGYDQGLLLARSFIGSGYRLIAPSRFGYLRTPLPVDGSAVAEADAYAALLDALGIDLLAVLAISNGGPSGLQFAIRHPQRTTGLIMLAAKSHSAPPEPLAQTAAFNAAFRSDYLYWLVTTRFASSMLDLLGMPADVQAALTAEQAAIARRFLEAMHPISLRTAGIFNERREITVLDPDVFRLDRITAPTLVIHGTRDTLQPFSHGQHTAESIPGARLVTLVHGGHMPVNHLAQIRDEIAAFLDASAPPAT